MELFAAVLLAAQDAHGTDAQREQQQRPRDDGRGFRHGGSIFRVGILAIAVNLKIIATEIPGVEVATDLIRAVPVADIPNIGSAIVAFNHQTGSLTGATADIIEAIKAG